MIMAPLKVVGIGLVVAAGLSIAGIQAQQPTPPFVVVQAAGAAPAATPAPTAASTSDVTISSAIKALEQVKAANDATLKKQEAMMQQLDEMQKAAEQLKIFSKRV